MKRFLNTFLILCAVALCIVLIPFGAKANTTADGLQYEISEGEVTITGYTGSATEFVIPEMIEGYPVTSIGDEAFHDCDSLTSITIPDSVTSIGDYAFLGCSSLISTIIADGVTSIGEEAFYDCVNLSDISIPDSIASIGYHAFSNCSSLPYSTYDNAKYIGNGNNPYVVLVKHTDDSITSCDLHPDVKVIYGGAFAGCSELTEIEIPSGVANIGLGAFDYCDNMTKVYITEIAAWCNINFDFFWYCSNPLQYAEYVYINGELVTELIIPDDVTVIKPYTFYGCDSITSVTISDSVVLCIGEGAFLFCGNLTSVSIGNGVTAIEYEAFLECGKLNSVTIGSGVTDISSAFVCCSETMEIIFKGSAPTISSYEFEGTTATAYYPAGNDTWTEDVLQDYGGNITWIPYEAYEPGDLDGVEGVDNRDVEYLLRYTLFPEDYPLLQRADFDGDGYVDNKDVECLLWHTLFPETYPL